MKIYTRTGDDGSTGLFGGGRVEKNHPRIRAYGTVDEVNSVLGIVVAEIPADQTFQPLRTWITRIQHELFVLGADLATPLGAKADVPRIEQAHLSSMEQTIDEIDAQLPPLSRFILPGGHHLAGVLHLARTTCRRAEREVVDVMSTEPINPFAVKYLNRLSDFLFVAARLANQLTGIPDVIWEG
jgi:cob(I)alamin adenosyltransferase